MSSYAPIVHTTAKQVKKTFHVVEITKTSVKHPKMKNAHAKRAKLSFLVVKYANLWRSSCHHHFPSVSQQPQHEQAIQLAHTLISNLDWLMMHHVSCGYLLSFLSKFLSQYGRSTIFSVPIGQEKNLLLVIIHFLNYNMWLFCLQQKKVSGQGW